MPRFAVAAAALAGLFAFAGAAGATEQRTWDRSFAVDAHPTVRIHTDEARVTVRSWSEPRVKVHVERRGSTHGLVLGRHRPTVTLAQRGNEVDISARMLGATSGFGIVIDTERFEVEVWLPRRCDLAVNGRDGAMRIEDVTGSVDVVTHDGPLTARGLRGEIQVRSQDGHVELDGIDGALHLETHDGTSDVRGRFDVVDVQSSDGRIELEAEPGSRMREEWSLRSRDGGIRLRVPPGLAATIDARTSDGSLDIDLPVEIRGGIRDHRLVGDMNGGGPTLLLRCDDGSIHLSAID